MGASVTFRRESPFLTLTASSWCSYRVPAAQSFVGQSLQPSSYQGRICPIAADLQVKQELSSCCQKSQSSSLPDSLWSLLISQPNTHRLCLPLLWCSWGFTFLYLLSDVTQNMQSVFFPLPQMLHSQLTSSSRSLTW